MGGILKLDSPFMNFLGKVADLMILNIYMVICCIPIITAGASITAMYTVLLKMVRKEEPVITKSFFSAFKENFAQSTILWMIVLLFGIFLGFDFYMFQRDADLAIFPKALRIAVMAITIIMAAVVLYIFPLQSRFKNNVKKTIRNAFLLSISQLPKTIAIMVMYVLFVLVYLCTWQKILPAILLLGVTVPCFFSAFIYNSIFKRFEPKTEESSELKPLSMFSGEETEAKEAENGETLEGQNENAVDLEKEFQEQETVQGKEDVEEAADAETEETSK